MALGPGKYDQECTELREKTQAEAVLVIVINGDRGHGFSAQTTNLDILAKWPAILRDTARQIEGSGGKA